MKRNRIKTIIYAALSLLVAAAALLTCVYAAGSPPLLLSADDEPRAAVSGFFDAVCAGDYGRLDGMLYGSPKLGLDADPADGLGAAILSRFRESCSYELVGGCVTTETGLSQTVSFTCLDVSTVVDGLEAEVTALIRKRVEASDDMSEVYDDNNEYREDFVFTALTDAAEALLDRAQTKTVTLDVRLQLAGGKWKLMPDDALLDIFSGGIMN